MLDFYPEVGAINAVLSGSVATATRNPAESGLSATRWAALTGDRVVDRSGLRRRQCEFCVMETRLQTLGWGTWALVLALIALVVLAVLLATPAA